jgi:hypothetical protein
MLRWSSSSAGFPLCLLVCLLACLGAHPSVAHDLPGKASLLMFAQQQDRQLLVLTRVPMEALTEIQFPLRGPGYLDLANADRALTDAAHLYVNQSMYIVADGVELPPGELRAVRAALPSDKSFAEFETALAHMQRAPLNPDTELYWKQASLDIAIAYSLPRADAKLAIDSQLDRISMETHTVLRYLPPDGAERIYTFTGNPGRIDLDPSWWRTAYDFVALGFEHILIGIDHLLFLLCLIVPLRSVRALVPVVTAFTVAHSITLISSALGLTPSALWFGPLVETLIALSVLYMACENALGIQLQRRWMLVFAFGLIHGFGFSFMLAERMQFAGEHLVSGLLAFNVGVELGQLAVLIIAVPALNAFFAYLKRVAPGTLSGERLGALLVSMLVAHTAWHWCLERGEQLLQYRWQWPVFDAAFFAAAMRWGMLIVGSAAVLWVMNELLNRWLARSNESKN